MAKKWIIGMAVAAVGSCAMCGFGAVVLGAAADDDAPASQQQAAAPAAGSGEHPAELVAFWDGGFEKFAFFADGTAKKWVRQAWLGGNNPVLCAMKGDFEGTWSVSGNQLSLEFIEGKWKDCNGDRDFEPLTYTYLWVIESTPNSASPFGLTLWLGAADGTRGGWNKKCADPGSCPGYLPDPL